MWKIFTVFFAIVAIAFCHVDYTGHQVLSAVPKEPAQLELMYKLRSDYGVDIWNEPKHAGERIMFRLKPELVTPVQEVLKREGIEYEVVFENLQSVVMSERVLNSPTKASHAEEFDFGKYNEYDTVIGLLQDLAKKYPTVAKLESIGKSYENRPIYNMKISSGASKPAIMMECGIHAREWSSVAACAYLVNKLITTSESDPEVKDLLAKYEFNIIVESNPDGYIYTWTKERLWRKTRSRSSIDWRDTCRGADANRNFDIDFCGVGTSRKPCDEIYCGDKAFSESESRALRDLMIALGSRIKAYFSVHAFSQLWMTPYGTSKKLPPNYAELERVGKAGVEALEQKHGTKYKLGTISNIIYEAAGSSVDYAYQVRNINISYALELRDTGRFGFFLPNRLILPMCEETYDGLVGAIKALQ